MMCLLCLAFLVKLKFLLILGRKDGLNGMKGMRPGGKLVKRITKNQDFDPWSESTLIIIRLGCITRVSHTNSI